ncbi:hypothetical protein GCM10027098_39860 [Bowmanella dokdonensis]
MFESGIDQVFWAWALPGCKQSYEGFEYYENGRALLTWMETQRQSVRFVFHGMFERQIWPYLTFSSVTARSSWVCWGAELYQHAEKGPTFKRKLMNLCHRVACKRMLDIFPLNAGDGKLIGDYIGARPSEPLPYPLIGVDVQSKQKKDQTLRILVGNSAAPSNEHDWIFQSLSKHANQDIELIVPLNYAGSEEYVAEVIKRGHELFADKFRPITSMLGKHEYDELLAKVDCAVFGHIRQQGLYVVYTMLKHGKKMYVRGATSTFTSMSSLGFHLYDSDELSTLTFEQFLSFDKEKLRINQQLMEETYSEQALIGKWRQRMLALFQQYP